MFHRDPGEGCPGCSFLVDNIGDLAHLHARDTSLALVSRAPLAEIAPFKARMGWTVPWYSSFGSDFNYDFHATTDEAVAPVEYNYRDQATLEKLGHTYHVKGEQPGVSVFLRDGDNIFHTDQLDRPETVRCHPGKTAASTSTGVTRYLQRVAEFAKDRERSAV